MFLCRVAKPNSEIHKDFKTILLLSKLVKKIYVHNFNSDIIDNLFVLAASGSSE